MITSEWPISGHPERAPFISQQVKFIRQAGVEVVVFSFRGKQNPFNYLIAWLKLRQCYRISEFDVVHAQFGQSGLLAFPATGRLVVTFHGSDLHGFPRRDGHYTMSGGVLRFLSRFVASRAKRVIVVSEHLKGYLPPQTHVEVIPCGVDFDLFKPMARHDARKKLSLPMDKHFVLFAANPNNPIKRHHLAKEAVGILQKQFDVSLVTISDVSHGLVPLYMNACDALVVTSAHEGSPMVVKEALACNLPVVSVDVGDVHQRIAEIEGCLLCKDGSSAVIADRLARVLNRGGRIEGRDAVRGMEIKIITRKIIEVYRSLLNGRIQE